MRCQWNSSHLQEERLHLRLRVDFLSSWKLEPNSSIGNYRIPSPFFFFLFSVKLTYPSLWGKDVYQLKKMIVHPKSIQSTQKRGQIWKRELWGHNQKSRSIYSTLISVESDPKRNSQAVSPGHKVSNPSSLVNRFFSSSTIKDWPAKRSASMAKAKVPLITKAWRFC